MRSFCDCAQSRCLVQSWVDPKPNVTPLGWENVIVIKALFNSARSAMSTREDDDTELLRSELLSIEQLKQHAVMLAHRHTLDPDPGPDKLLPRLADNERVLLAAYDVVTAAAIPGQRIVSAEVWLLDNYYLIEQQIDLARRHLPLGYSRQLPRLAEGISAGFPRIYDLALALISHMDGRVDNDNVTHIVAAYQTVTPLKMGELWAFPIMLQLALLENIRRIGQRIVSRREELDTAVAWADRMLAALENEPNKLILLLAEFANADVPLTAAFVDEFYSRLQAQGPAMLLVQTWVEQQLLDQGVSASQLAEVAGRSAAASQISIANSIGSLRFIGAMDWRSYVESLSAVEHTLALDPAGMHATQDFATRDRYRHVIEEVARNSPHSEVEVAREAITLAQAAASQLGTEDRTAHVGYYLIEQGRRQLEQLVGKPMTWQAHARRISRHYSLPLYLMPILVLTVLTTWLALTYVLGVAGYALPFWLLLLPLTIGASALAIALVNLSATLILPPRALPRLDFSKGIPAISRTLVVVPTQLSSQQDIDRLLEALEIRYLGNSDPHLFFALLTDYYDATECTLPTDAALLEHARAGIQALNATYQTDRPCIFYLFHRPRVWNPHEQVWMGYERKRGKLEELNARLRGGALNAFSDIVGDTTIFSSIRYVITLDTDTQLPRDTARKLIGNIAHPLNRPVYSAEKGRIVEGYAILQPRASISLVSAEQTWFTKLFAGESSVDPYTREVSDVYQDIFGEGSFIGKGIYDVDAFRLAVDGRFPENLILSHDLLESGYARSALVSDIDLIEEHPASYVTDISRRHRWIRGDWQLAGWLLPSVPGPGDANDTKPPRCHNQLTALLVWKIFDNLRRSLVSPSLLALLMVGCLSGVGAAWHWMLLVAGLVFMPTVLSILIEAIRKPEARDWFSHWVLTARGAVRPLLMALLTIALLPYDAMICLDAIVRSGVRMLFTRRGLLIWHLGSYSKRNARHSLIEFFLEMWIAPALALMLGWALLLRLEASQATQLLLYSPLLLLWLLAPVIGWWMSKPLIARPAHLSQDQRTFLRLSARRTWRFFAQFVSAEHHWLPPDNIQEYPIAAIAARTSPTNIGMALLSNLAAYDFGYITAGELLRLTANTLATMQSMERYHGHFYNWYDTQTLQPLHPQYVSSVDSGNLAGSLLTLQAGLAELKVQPVLPGNAWQGLHDTLRVLADYVAVSHSATLAKHLDLLDDSLQAAVAFKAPLQRLSDATQLLTDISGMAASMISHLPDNLASEHPLSYWAHAFYQQCLGLQDELALVGDLHNSDHTADNEMPSLLQLAAQQPAHAMALARLDTIDHLIEQCRQLAQMDFEFLYDTSRDLLSIGFDVGERRRDPSCYDLLASEARLASFLLIAEGKVPQKHWFSLGRLLTSHGGDVSLISWSGSMFEYLMPTLLMQEYASTLLGQTCRTVVLRQIEYGRQRGVPWGISESGYNTTDASQIYQYRAFGIPGLGFKRGLGDDLVIAPYASALALLVMPEEASHNLQALAKAGFLGDYGFYEAIDYTPSRVPRGKTHAIVRSFMAHHQGMSLLAFDHVLNDQPMQRRFMSTPLVKATELLLQERVPKRGATLHPHMAEVTAAAKPPAPDSVDIMRVFTNPNTAVSEVHLLSNGRYHVMASHAGGGYSRWRDLAVTRWREDATSDAAGTFVYLRDSDNGHYWSSSYQPTLTKPDHYEAIFVQGRAEYRRRDEAIEAHTEIAVSPEDDVEIRRVTLTNLSSRTRHIEVTSYAEVVLAALSSDLSHRAFSNLFVQTEILPERQAILCSRRRRTPEEQVPWMFHLLAAPDVVNDAVTYETDRAQFIGRSRTLANPQALDRGQQQLSNSSGSVLDPIVAIRRGVTLSVDASATVHFITGVADTREGALMLLSKYCDRHFIERAFEMAWFHSQGVLRQINATEADAQMFGRLAGSVIYGSAMRRAAPSVIARNRLRQSGLWRFSVSGDMPIVLLCIGDVDRVHLVKQVLQAHAYWRMKGLIVDLVIINEDFSGYRAVLQDQIMGLINAGVEAKSLNQPGGVFVRRIEDLSEDERVLLMTVARIVFTDTTEILVEQVERRVLAERVADRYEVIPPAHREQAPQLAVPQLIFNNGIGGFTADGREYVIHLKPGQATPAPWVNVIASPHIGTVVSESGSAYTWVENAHEFRLTTWHNDPVTDASAEAYYIRDEDTGAFWSPTPLPATGQHGYICRHGFGYSVFEHVESGIASSLHTYVAMDAPVKFVVIKLTNQSNKARRLSLTGYWELVLGEWRHANLMHIVTEVDTHSGAMFARNAYGRECANRLFFAKVSGKATSVSGNRAAFIGRNGTLKSPAAMYRKRLSGMTGAGFDPCAVLQTHVELAVGQTHEVVFMFGATANADEARQLIHRMGEPDGARQALEAVWQYWQHTLGAVHVETPDPAMDVLVNGWLLYQTISSRLWGRSGYYQSGGAFGFRDQLQDTMALIHTTPALAREQIVRCAGHQFPQGDVQHWWHPPHGQGVRTHFSDDYLWLAYATCRYVTTTGDTGILDEAVHFLEGRELKPEEEAYYDQPQRSTEVASVYEHCVRAIQHGLRFGTHQLPLMGCGDWNDGMNLVGREGKGESVWLAWFLYENLQLFSGLARRRGDAAFADTCTAQAWQLRNNIESNAWDGAWYRRAYFDDGTALGSANNDECKIDSISQSWAVISGGGDAERARLAMQAVDEHLVKRDAQLVQLLSPPFDTSHLEPGYIKGYVPGVRENGGQYTHAAIWTSMAYGMMGDNARAWEVFTMLNPIRHASSAEAMQRYKVEPYVMSADIYAAQPHTGRGGWTWYTGAAGWMYRLSLETLLGVQLEVDHLRITPCIPADWNSYQVDYRHHETLYHITVHRVVDVNTQTAGVIVDGVRIYHEGTQVAVAAHHKIPLVNDQQVHQVEVYF
ncbi:MAG TPA: glucoamylase family protein [Methylophilus sp.]